LQGFTAFGGGRVGYRKREGVAVAVDGEVLVTERTAMKNAKKTVVTPLINPIIVASEMIGCVSSKPNTKGNAMVVGFQMLCGEPATAGFDESETIEEKTPSGKVVKTKIPTGKRIEWDEAGVLIFDQPIEVNGQLYWVSTTQRKIGGKGKTYPALVLKPVKTTTEPEAAGTTSGLSY